MEDEIDVLKSVKVSGEDDWDCFITIVHFQQCGRCSPSSREYTTNASGYGYVTDSRGWSIRPCRQACEYIWKQCKDADLLDGTRVVPVGMSVEAFCAEAPAASTPELPCYNSGSPVSHLVATIVAAMVVATLAW